MTKAWRWIRLLFRDLWLYWIGMVLLLVIAGAIVAAFVAHPWSTSFVIFFSGPILVVVFAGAFDALFDTWAISRWMMILSGCALTLLAFGVLVGMIGILVIGPFDHPAMANPHLRSSAVEKVP